jgi:hypothetical protein
MSEFKPRSGADLPVSAQTEKVGNPGRRGHMPGHSASFGPATRPLTSPAHHGVVPEDERATYRGVLRHSEKHDAGERVAIPV